MARPTVQWYGAKLNSQALTGAQKGVNEITARIARAAPGFLSRGHGVASGKLKRNIRAEKAKRRGTRITGKASPTKRAWYGRFVASGAAKHKIEPKKSKFLVWRSKAVGFALTDKWGHKIGTVGGDQWASLGAGVKAKSIYATRKAGKTTKSKKRAAMIFAKGVKHPGAAANDFMQRALDQVWPGAPAIIAAAGGQSMKK